MPNFHEVDAHFYRGARPDGQGFQSLAKLGVKTVIDLQLGEERSLAEKQAVEKLGMHYISIPMHGMSAPGEKQMAEVFTVLHNSTAWPVFVHCRRGKDRTGTVVACYRIEHEGWQNQRALNEARYYGMSWVERAMQHYILHFKSNYAFHSPAAGGHAGILQPSPTP